VATALLIGEHISYSASPAMHSGAFLALGLDHAYELADLTSADLPAVLGSLSDEAYLGANVTVPHKAAVIEHLDEIDPLAQRAGAVNTIVAREGRLLGSNTDIPAIRDEIAALNGSPRCAVVLGAGGAARAVAIALEMVGAREIISVSRSGREGAASWDDLTELLAEADLLINATPVGTNSDASVIDPDLMHEGLRVLDLVYRPSPTRLVHEARSRGLDARAGAGVLLGQGWRSLEAWLQLSVSDNVKRAMADALSSELGSGADV
jgi:shikimate dehydrogenase